MVQCFIQLSPVTLAFIETCFTWFLIILGAGLVFFFKKIDRKIMEGMFGLAIMMPLDVALD